MIALPFFPRFYEINTQWKPFEDQLLCCHCHLTMNLCIVRKMKRRKVEAERKRTNFIMYVGRCCVFLTHTNLHTIK